MKILIIRNYPNHMDVQFNTYNIQEIGLAKALIRKGHVCDIVFWADKEEKIVDYIFDGDKHIKVFYRFGKNILKNAIYNNLDYLIGQYDVIQPCEYNQYQSWLLAKKYPNKTVIYHGPYYSNFNKRYNLMCKVFNIFFLKRYIKIGTKFMVKSNLAQQFLISKGIREKNIKVVGVGIDLGALIVPDNSQLPEFINGIDEFENEIKLLYIGRFEERRNITFLFDVIKSLSAIMPNIKLIMVGHGDNEYVNQCFKYADEIGITRFIYRIERLEQRYLSYVYKKTNFFLLPTKYEIFGMVLLEAMHFGSVVLTTKNGGSDITIKDRENGIILKDSDPIEWAKIIATIYEDKDLYQKLSKNAQKSINKHFTWDNLVDRFIDFYEKVRG